MLLARVCLTRDGKKALDYMCGGEVPREGDMREGERDCNEDGCVADVSGDDTVSRKKVITVDTGVWKSCWML